MSRVALVVLVLGFFPGSAWANVGIGYLAASWPALLLALVPVIFIEAQVLSAILRLPFWPGVKLSARANIRSTLLGLPIALVVDLVLSLLAGGSAGFFPSRGSAVASLVPMLFVTWWIEHRAITRKLPEQPHKRIALATFAANALSYAALAAAVAWMPFFKFYDQMAYREHVYIATHAVDPWQTKVSEYWQAHKRFPERPADIGLDAPEARRHVRGVTLGPGGRIVLELDFPQDPELDRKQLVYEPRVAGDGLKWQCRAPGLNPRYVPPSCPSETNTVK